MTTETYSPDDFILGPDLVVTTVGHFQGGINVPRLTPIMLDATVGTFKVWDGSVGKAIGLTATAVNTGSSSADCSYYKSGSFRYTQISICGYADQRRLIAKNSKQAASGRFFYNRIYK